LIDYSSEFELLANAYQASGGNPDNLRNNQYGLMLVSGNQILGKNEILGLRIECKSLQNGVQAKIIVEKNTTIANPVHLCFGIIPSEGEQHIIADFIIENNASATFLAHCSFPNAIKVKHNMEGTVKIGKNSVMEYSETHYHGSQGGVQVMSKMEIDVDSGGRYKSTFHLIKGVAGQTNLNYKAYLNKNAIAEMYTRIYGKRQDDIKVKESIYLNGSESKGLAKSRIVLTDKARAEVLGEIIGKGAYSRGHIDCMEIVQGKKAIASAVPKLKVVNETAKLTHEAAIGSVDKRQVETLMARGLTEQEAIDVIVTGLLR